MLEDTKNARTHAHRKDDQEIDAMSDNPVWKAVKPFSNGGMSGMIATCCIQPIDIVKVSCEIEESKKAGGRGRLPHSIAAAPRSPRSPDIGPPNLRH